mgnify:CR=1 FL=1
MPQAAALFLFFLLLPPPSGAETYDHWVASCRSYRDVAAWLNDNFRCHHDRTGRIPGGTARQDLSRKRREEIFRHRTGCPLEASLFARETLNRINPEYRARLIHLCGDRPPAHYLCGFYLGEKLFIMDYWNAQEHLNGTHGPFENPGDYLQSFYLRRNPARAGPVRCAFGLAPGIASQTRQTTAPFRGGKGKG